jgi:eukaryotic-like serine/threonine-protein kinase
VAAEWRFLCQVPFIVFEAADGDVRAAMARAKETIDLAWSLRVLHGVANGLRQLHQAEIEHQDLKPSNVMTFDKVAKVGDLGRASNGGNGQFNHLPIAGDLAYAPPELLFREENPDDRYRRRAVDAYHLGSLAVFVFAGVGLTTLLSAELGDSFHWRTWPRDYRNALPYVREAFDRVMVNVTDLIPEQVRNDVHRLIRELCDPDPLLRGDAKRGDSIARLSMDRYVSLLDKLARAAESGLRRAA